MGIKYIIVDVPRPQRGAYIPNAGPGQFPTTQSNVGKS